MVRVFRSVAIVRREREFVAKRLPQDGRILRCRRSIGGAAVAATQPVVGPAVTQTATESLTETVPPSVGDLSAFRSALERDGFIVQQGAAATFPLIEAYEAGLIKPCWGNDPTKSYFVCLVAPSPGEEAPSYKFKVGEFLGLKGVTILFRMRPAWPRRSVPTEASLKSEMRNIKKPSCLDSGREDF